MCFQIIVGPVGFLILLLSVCDVGSVWGNSGLIVKIGLLVSYVLACFSEQPDVPFFKN